MTPDLSFARTRKRDRAQGRRFQFNDTNLVWAGTFDFRRPRSKPLIGHLPFYFDRGPSNGIQFSIRGWLMKEASAPPSHFLIIADVRSMLAIALGEGEARAPYS